MSETEPQPPQDDDLVLDGPNDDTEAPTEVAQHIAAEQQAEAEEVEEGFGLAEQIAKDVASQTVTLELGRREVPFYVLTGAEMDDMEEQMTEMDELGERADEEDWSMRRQRDEVKPYFHDIAETLAEKDTTGELPKPFWLETYGTTGIGAVMGQLRQKSEEAGMTDEQLENLSATR